jgi:hypothetical protein
MQVDESFTYICFTKLGKAVHKMLGNFGATFPILGKFFNSWQLFSIEQPLTLKTINYGKTVETGISKGLN